MLEAIKTFFGICVGLFCSDDEEEIEE